MPAPSPTKGVTFKTAPVSKSDRTERNVPESTLQQNRDSDILFIIQLASFRDRGRAEAIITRLYNKRPSLFPATGLRIQSHTLPSGSEFFRVLSTPINRDKATSLCEILWKDRIGCLIKTAN